MEASYLFFHIVYFSIFNPSVRKDRLVYDDEKEKENLLKDFFRVQTLLAEHGVATPAF